MNPQENVWPWAEKHLRQEGGEQGTFADFQKAVLKPIRAYPAEKLLGGIVRKIAKVYDAKGRSTQEGGSKKKDE